MGIKGLSAFIKEKSPNCSMDVDISTFKGNKIAIDSALFLNKFAFSAHNTLLYQMEFPIDDYDPNLFTIKLKDLFLTFIINFIIRGITPVVIFDGPSNPEKEKCQIKRKSERETLKNKVEQEMMNYRNKDPLKITTADDDKLLKLRGQFYKIGNNDYNYIETMLRQIGIPVFKAEHDGEKLCASLSLEKLVAAVCTNDSDSQPLGTYIMISEVNFYGISKMTYLQPILNFFVSEFNCSSYEEALFYLREFSILCGCDFNTNIPKVGPANSLKLLKTHKTIESISSVKDISCLNHIHCRTFFNYTPSNIVPEDLYINWDLFDRNISFFKPKDDNSFDFNLQRIDKKLLSREKIVFENGV